MTNLSATARRWAAALNRPITVLLALQLLGGMLLAPQRTFLPVYLKELGYSAVWISWMATAQRLAGLLAAAWGGSLSDTLGRERTLLLGQVGVLLAGLVFFASSPWLIALLYVVSGVGASLQTLGSQSYLLDNARPQAMGVITALYNWGYTVGGALGAPLAGWLLDAGDYTALALPLALGSVLALLINRFWLPPSAVGTEQRARAKVNLGYREIATRPAVLLLAALRFLPTFYWGMALILIPLMLDDVGASKTLIALYATVSQILASLAQIVAGRAADRLGCKVPTLVTFALLALSVSATGLLPGALWAIFVFGSLGASAAWALSTLMPCWVAQVTPSAERGRVLGWVHLWWNLGMVLGSLVGGALFERNVGLPFLVAAGGVLVATALAVAFFRRANAPQADAAATR